MLNTHLGLKRDTQYRTSPSKGKFYHLLGELVIMAKHHAPKGMRPTFLNMNVAEDQLQHKAGTIEHFIKKDRKGKFV
jgi:site-specific recombinase